MNRTRITAIVLVVALGLGGYWYWSRAETPDEEGYLTATVERGPIAETVIATGIVNALATVQVGTYVSGPIIAIDVDFNSAVRKGQRVAKIDPAPFQVKMMKAEANLATARANVEKARADLELKGLLLERYTDLRRQDFVAQNDVDTARSNHRQAVAQLTLAESGVKQADADRRDAQINLDYTDITAPVDGVVVSRNVDVGQTVAASFQTPTLFQIAQDLSRMQVIASVSESDIADVRDRQSSSFTVDAYPGRNFEGVVSQVRNAPITVQNVVTYNVVIDVDNREGLLRPGMTANVVITTAAVESALKVPVRALGFDPNRVKVGPGTPLPTRAPGKGKDQGVWRLRADGTLERVKVESGLRDENFAEVKSGDLHEGDQAAIGARAQREKTPAAQVLGMPRVR